MERTYDFGHIVAAHVSTLNIASRKLFVLTLPKLACCRFLNRLVTQRRTVCFLVCLPALSCLFYSFKLETHVHVQIQSTGQHVARLGL
jgi:hypothetical protein